MENLTHSPVPAREPQPELILFDCRCQPKVIKLRGNMTFGRIYDGEQCDITAQSCITGRRHGEFLWNPGEGACYYIDNNSLNGTYLNGKRLAPYNARGSHPVRLHDGDILRVDRAPSEQPHQEAVVMIYRTTAHFGVNWRIFDTFQLVNITLGRDENNVIRLNDSAVSRRHAVLRRETNGWRVFDRSQNGVKLNGKRIEDSCAVRDHDVLSLGDTTLVIYGNILLYGKPVATTANG